MFWAPLTSIKHPFVTAGTQTSQGRWCFSFLKTANYSIIHNLYLTIQLSVCVVFWRFAQNNDLRMSPLANTNIKHI